MVVGQHPGDVRQQPVAVERLDLDLHEEDAGRRRRPLDLDDPVRLGAAAPPTLPQSSRCTETPLPRVTKPMIGSPGTGVQQRASLTQTSSMPLTTTPGSPVRGAPRPASAWSASARSSSAPASPPSACTSRCDDAGRRHVALADRRVQAGDVEVAHLGRQRDQRLVRHQPLHRQVLLAHRLGDRVLAVSRSPPRGAPWRTTAGSCCAPAALLTKVSQSRLGPAASALEVKISTTSPLSSVALQRHQPAVDPRAHAAVPDLGVDRVGEVDRRRPGRQRDDVALGGEDVDLAPR